MKQASCEERIGAELESTLAILGDLWELLQTEGPEAYHAEHGTNLEEYGLCFDYVSAGTFGDQDEGYYRYQLSWGGPSDEFRFYMFGNEAYKVDYHFMDWYDGARRRLHGPDEVLLMDIFGYFALGGMCETHKEDI